MMISVLLGGAIGAAMGYFGQCSSGACPLTATGWRGALFGAVIGFLFYFTGASGKYSHPKDVKRITEAEFEREVLESGMPVVVDFYAPWCGPCKTQAAVLDRLTGEFSGNVKFVSVNLDEAPNLAREFNVQAIPTLLFFHAGKVVESNTGVLAADQLRSRIQSLIQIKG